MRRRDGGDGDFGALLHVVFDHAGDVHAVDVIAAEDGHHVRIGLLHQVDVLVDGVRRALIPGFVLGAHLRRHRDDELILQQAAELPALAQVLQQRLAAELRQHIDRINSRVDEVAQHEVDDPVLAAEGTAGLARSLVSGASRVPLPPARTMPSTRIRISFKPYCSRARVLLASTKSTLSRINYVTARSAHAARMTAMAQTRFATASVVGTGMMGPGIALTLAMGGIRATLLSRTADARRGTGKGQGAGPGADR